MEKRTLLIVVIVTVGLALPDLFVHKHVYFHDYEALPGFFALLGLAAAVLMMVVARLVAALLRRDENYYG